MSLILRFLILLAITRLLLADAAVSMTGNSGTATSKYTHHYSIFRVVAKTYQYDPIFAAKDYETYVNTSGMDMTPPVLLHQFGLASTRHRQQQRNKNQASSATTAATSSSTIIDKSTAATSELLVSGPALAFIVVLTLGAFMF